MSLETSQTIAKIGQAATQLRRFHFTFKGADLSNSCFREGDIRGADFGGSTASGAVVQYEVR
jgi:uncharacterized protein YjbI with pentapeptide repeats